MLRRNAVCFSFQHHEIFGFFVVVNETGKQKENKQRNEFECLNRNSTRGIARKLYTTQKREDGGL